jgi:carboxymethylenebutenolidase
VIEHDLRIQTPDGMLPVFTVRPEGDGPFPLALLYMDGIGFRDQIRANARRFAAEGFFVAAPDLYYRSGEGIAIDMRSLAASGFQGPEADRMRQIMATASPDGVARDTEAIVAELGRDPAAETSAPVLVGYCFGARMSLHVASARDDVAAAAGIHPGALVTDAEDSPHRELASVHGDLYFAFAENDRTATPEAVDAFRDAIAAQGLRGEVERLPGTSHGFAMADQAVYDEDACERHYAKTVELWRGALA